VAVDQVHADLEVHARSDVYAEVVRLQHRGSLQDSRRDLDQWIVVVKLVSVGLLLLAKCKGEAGVTAALSIHDVLPGLVVVGMGVWVREHDGQLKLRRYKSSLLLMMRGGELELYGVRATIEDSHEAGSSTRGENLRVLGAAVFEAESQAFVFCVQP
jgi:hypothetical protein